MQLFALRLAALSAALLLCVAPVAAATNGPPVDIDVILPMSGPAAQYGHSLQQGYQTLETLVNAGDGIRGRPVKFTVFDDQTNPQVEVQLANQIVSKGSQVFLGGALSAMCKSAMPLFAEKGPVFYCMSPAVLPPRGGYVFSGSYHPVDLAAFTFRFFRQHGWNNIALLMGTDATGQEVDAKVESLLAKPENRGLHIVAHEYFAPSEISVAAQVAKVKAARPQAILVWTGVGIDKVFHALNDADVRAPVATSSGFMLYTSFEQFASFLPPQLYFAAPKWAAYPAVGAGPVRESLDKYFATFRQAGIKPDIGHNIAWDPASIVVAALRALGPDARAPQIRDWIEQLHGFTGSNGFYDFRTGDQRGLNPNDVVMVEWSAAKKTWVAVK